MAGTKEGGESGTREQSSTGGSAADDVRRAFSSLPFDQQMSTLVRIELDMLGDAVDTVVSTVSKALDDIARACECSESTASATSGPGSQASTS